MTNQKVFKNRGYLRIFASYYKPHWKLFLLMHRLFTQKDFLLIKIYTMKNWLLKHFRLQKLLIRL